MSFRKHSLARYIRDDCRCDKCSREYRSATSLLARYLDGESLQALADDVGKTREMIRWTLDAVVGGYTDEGSRAMPVSGAAARLQRAMRTERDALADEIADMQLAVAAERDGIVCATCGRPHHHTDVRQPSGWAVTCSPACARMWGEVRYLTPYRDIHMQRIASWALRHQDQVTEYVVRNARRVRVGLEAEGSNAGQRWLIEGSARFNIAVRAYREGWPSFDTWPEQVRRQIIGHVESHGVARSTATVATTSTCRTDSAS